jgi:hypothetical protein
MKTNRRTLGQIASRLHALDKRGTTDALEIGALLIEAKERLATEQDQSFTNWLQSEFAWSHRTADRFMRARKWYEAQPVSTRHCVESDLTVSALYVISGENAPAEAEREILKLAKKQRVGGTLARQIVADVSAKAQVEADTDSREPVAAEFDAQPPGDLVTAGEEEAPSSEVETADPEEAPDSDLVLAIEILLECDPEVQSINGLNAPDLMRAVEVLTALARRLRNGDAVKLAADRAEARSARVSPKAGPHTPDVEADAGEVTPEQICPIDHSAEGAVPLFMCRTGLPHALTARTAHS